MNKFLPIKRPVIYRSVFGLRTNGRSIELGAKGEAANLLAATAAFCLIVITIAAIARS